MHNNKDYVGELAYTLDSLKTVVIPNTFNDDSSINEFDVFANYTFSEKLTARLNVANITDENYYLTAYRSGGFAYIGDARNAQLTVAYEF